VLQAHPPIKIIDTTFDLNEAKKHLPEKYYKIYKIIFELNSKTPSFNTTTKISLLEIVTDQNYCFLFLNDENRETLFNVGDNITFSNIKIDQTSNHITFENFLRFIKEANIGKPSTYGSVLKKLFSDENAYLEIKEGHVIHTETGSKVYQCLQKNKRQIVSYQFNIDLEAALDNVETGLSNSIEILNQFLSPYVNQEINKLDVNFELDIADDNQTKSLSHMDTVYTLIPDDHYLQGLKISSDDILSTRPEEHSNSLYKLKVLYDYFEINTIEALRERFLFDISFRWFLDFKMTDTIPTADILTEFIFSDMAISYSDLQ
jgi:hypothetical protein